MTAITMQTITIVFVLLSSYLLTVIYITSLLDGDITPKITYLGTVVISDELNFMIPVYFFSLFIVQAPLFAFGVGTYTSLGINT